MNKKAGKFFMILGALLIAAAVALAVYNNRENKSAGKQSQHILPSLESLMEDAPEADTDSVNGTDSFSGNFGSMSTVKVDGYDYIGKLTFPTLHLELPVMAQWDYTRLKIAPCLYYGSTISNNMVIAGHNYTSHFGKLSNLKIGDSVIFTDVHRQTYFYAVADIEQLGAYDTKDMIDSGYPLSLYTCDYSGTNRITVRCSRTSE